MGLNDIMDLKDQIFQLIDDYGSILVVFIIIVFLVSTIRLLIYVIKNAKPNTKISIPKIFLFTQGNDITPQDNNNIPRPSLERHRLIYLFNEWINHEIKDIKFETDVENLLLIKFKIWRVVFQKIAKDHNKGKIKEGDLYKYIDNHINQTTIKCYEEWKKANIPQSKIDAFNARHLGRTSMVSNEINHIVFNNHHMDQEAKIEVFFIFCIGTFGAAINDAKILFKEPEDKKDT